VSLVARARERFSRPPSRYERAWFRSINAVGLAVLVAVVLDLDPVLGSGQTGVFRRALYPLVPPALTLGVAVAGGYRRGTLLSAGLLVGYVLLLAAVGTVGRALELAPGYLLVGVGFVAASAVAGWLWTARP
jgi:hypothetical protein